MSLMQQPEWLGSVQHYTLLSVSFGIAAVALFFLSSAFYNLFLHPLRSYPGPLLWRISHVPWDYYMYNGALVYKVAALHQKYGKIVRTGPNKLSYAEAQAWKDIWTHNPGKEEWPKDPTQINRTPNRIPSILGADKENHTRYRRLLSHAFSEKGLREQEGLIKKYIDLLIDRLSERAEAGQTTDMVDWYTMTVFDVIGDLSWGEAFNSLHDRKVHDWIPAVQDSARFTLMTNVLHNNNLDFLNVMPKELQANRIKNYRYSADRVQARIDYGAQHGQRGDFFDRILIKSADDNKGGEGMTQGEMLNNAAVLVLGGSETSSTTLSGATYLLLKHPHVMEKLVREIRTAFKTDEEITISSVGHLKYLDAVLEEAMRFYPPVAFMAPRVAPKGGAVACGKFIPENTTVSVSFLALNRGPYFHRPDDFVPERRLSDAPAEFANDNKAAFQPFSLGTRNCIGRNLAYAEMRLILTKVLWHFDLTLDEKTGDWFDQKVYALWLKKPLYVKLAAARH